MGGLGGEVMKHSNHRVQALLVRWLNRFPALFVHLEIDSVKYDAYKRDFGPFQYHKGATN